MSELNEFKTRLLADDKIDAAEVEEIRQHLFADGKIDREEVEFLVTLREKAKEVCPEFDELFFAALTQNVLTDGSIDADEAAWLRKTVFADGKIDEGEKKFLTNLRSKAKQVCPEFEQLCAECAKA